MKTKLLWIGIPSVLIIAVAGFVFFDAKNLEFKQNNTVIEKSEQVIPLYHGTIDEDKDWTYLSIEDCYDESGVLNEKPNIDDNGNIINCYNENREKDGKWVTYTESRFGKEYKHEINYKKGKENGKSIHYDENGKISLTEYNKNGERDGEIIFYDNGKIREKGNYVNGEPEGEHIEYFDGEWMSKTIYESGEIIDIQDNHEVIEKFMKYYENEKLILENIWNKFSAGGVINNDEFEDLVISIYSDYGIYYDEIINDDEEIREFHEDMYKRNYEDKSWELLALYSMMNCSEDPSNPDTYLFNLDNPKLAQETYFKNCPKGCRYSDEEDVDFVCE